MKSAVTPLRTAQAFFLSCLKNSAAMKQLTEYGVMKTAAPACHCFLRSAATAWSRQRSHKICRDDVISR